MNERLYVGIDNGISGAMAALTTAGEIVHLAPLPVITVGRMTVLDAATFHRDLAELARDRRPHILVEPAQLFSPGKKALTSTWMCYGALRAILEIGGYAWEPINPQTWQREMFAGHVREVDRKEDGKQRKKTASIVVAQRLFPGAKLTRTEKSKTLDSGLADALLIASFCQRKR
jgi:hypothetical protein